jgi:nucleoside-triphosphatase THEP1
MLVILSGPLSIGKSTVCERLADISKSRGITCGGILTLKTPEGGIFARDLLTGEEAPLAGLAERPSSIRLGKYYFEPSGLAFGMDAIHRGLGLDLLVVDELGYLEMRGEGFSDAIPQIDARRGHSIVIIRDWLVEELRPRFSCPSVIYDVSVDNRDSLPSTVLETLFPDKS